MHSLVIIDQQGLNADHLRILHDGYLADLAQAIRNGTAPSRDDFRLALKLSVVLPEQIVLLVDYRQSFERRIAAGNYNWKDSDITPKRFPVQGVGIQQFEAKLFHFDRDISSERAVEEIKASDTANPWEPGKIEHVLSFGATYPEEQRKYTIIGLGSVAVVGGGGRSVPCLYVSGLGPVWIQRDAITAAAIWIMAAKL